MRTGVSRQARRLVVGIGVIWLLAACGQQSHADAAPDKVVTLLFTNDIESAYESVPAWWLEDIERIGGIPELATLINTIRDEEPNVFLFDAGDIFTGALSRLTDGALMFEFMISMGYDAMAIGNHEFDYGEAKLEWQKNRVPFPVLGANLYYKDTKFPFAQPHAIIERDGIRIGVVGILGQDAASTAVARDHIDELDVTDPAEAVARSVKELRDDVDLIVLLTHMGHTAPMQTDAEADPRLARDIDADLALAGSVEGIDVLFGGHADAGTPEPVVQPETGTIVMQTYGQATYLGFLQLTLDGLSGEIKSYDGGLIPVDATSLEPDPVIVAKNARYEQAFPEIMQVVGRNEARLNRKYFDESDIGNLIADIKVYSTGADIGLMHPGGIRKDLPKGDIRILDILDTSPFVDDVVVVEMTGALLKRALEQSFSHLRGLMQVAGIETVYDTSRPVGTRLISVTHRGRAIQDTDTFEVAVSGIIARGGDHFDMFLETKTLREYVPLSELMIAYYREHGSVAVPVAGRQKDLATND
ncbi:MAG: bifunctional metallophosphatase/5'-nucleotidase [Gammaproteobacteria bacterium]|nr:bifunctional metallophosphatase/5'-nucleotidase [Gammaproteobacteria bacterium]